MGTIDFGRHSQDYSEYRPGFPPSFYQRVNAVIPIRGTRALDLATGPGTVALELCALGSSVVGIDNSVGQIAVAKRAARQRGMDNEVQFFVSSAESTGLEAKPSFDLVTAGQCWHWFDSDAVLSEVERLLRPGGLLFICHFSYLADQSPVARDTEELVLQFNPSWSMAGHTGTYPERIDEVTQSGFEVVDVFSYEHDEAFSHAAWRGRIRTCNGVGSGGLSPAEVTRFDEALRHLLAEKYPDPMSVEHRVWCLVARKPE